MPSPFPCSPVIRECSWQKTQIAKKKAIKEKSRKRCKNLSEEEKDKIKEYQRKKYQELVQYKKEVLKNK